MPRDRRQLLCLTGSMVGITAVLAAAQTSASALDNSTGGRPWTVYAVGSSKAITPFQVGASNTLSPFAERPVSSKPGSSVISPDGETLYVTSTNGTNVFVTPYNTATRKAGRPISIGPFFFPGPMALSPDGSTLYVATFGDSGTAIFAISTSSRSVRPLTLDFPAAVVSLAVSPDGRTLFGGYAYVSPGVVALDTSTGDFANGFTTNYVPIALSVAPGGLTLWAKALDLIGGSGEETLIPLSLTTGDVGSPISLGFPKEGGFRPEDLVITPDGKTAYVNGTGGVIPVDLVNRTAESPICLDNGGDIVDAIAITPDGRTLEVAHRLVTTIDLATNAVRKSLKATPWPIALLISPDQAPIAKFLATAHPHGSPTSFNASGSHAVTGRIKTYTWQFGDGQTATTSTPTTTHVYSQAGSYTATLTVTDTAGTSTTVVYTGQSVLRNGGPSAQKSVMLNIG